MVEKKQASILILVLVYLTSIVIIITSILSFYKNITYFQKEYNHKTELLLYQKQNIRLITNNLINKNNFTNYLKFSIGDNIVNNVFLNTSKYKTLTNINLQILKTNTYLNLKNFNNYSKVLLYSTISNNKYDLKVFYLLEKKNNKFILKKIVYINY